MTQKILKPFFIMCVIFFSFPFSFVYSATTNFKVNVDVINDEDVSPPTQPTGLAGVVLSQTSIDLSWNESLDDYGIYRYKIFRNDILIGYSTSTSFIDTNVIVNMSYEYYVVAVDYAINESLPSETITITTQEEQPEPEPEPTQDGGTSTGTRIPLTLNDFSIVTTETTANLNWNTPSNTSFTIRYGKSPDTELLVIQSEKFGIYHAVTIENLFPNTKYYFEIEIRNRTGQTAINRGEFYTSVVMGAYPGNVSNFNIVANDGYLFLSWINPKDLDFEGVRIVKSDIFFPTGIYDGELIYVGKGNNFVDKDVEINKTYYYTIFVYNNSKNYSSGVIGKGTVLDKNLGQIDLGPFDIKDSLKPESIIDIKHLFLFQDGEELKKYEWKENKYFFDFNKDLILKIPVESLRFAPKAIIVTILNPNFPESVQSFLMRLDQEKKYYELKIPPRDKSDMYNLIITFMDFDNANVSSFQINLIDKQIHYLFYDNKILNYLFVFLERFWWLFSILILIIILILFRRSK